MKKKNRLLDFDMIIYQDDDYLKFSLDSVLLANFVTINLRTKKIIDLASGNAPIPMLMSMRTKSFIDAVELQKEVYNLGVESIKENKLDDQIKLICGDVKNIQNYYDGDCFDIVTCNPPYFNTLNEKFLNSNDIKAIARHEISLSLEDVVKAAFYLLKTGGNLAMVHRTDRFVEVIECLKKYNFEPKRVQFIYPKLGKNSDLFLIEASKNGKIGLKVLSSLIIHNDDNSYNENIRKYFSNNI